MIIIIDYGVGNLGSIKNMIGRLGYQCVISNNKEEIQSANKLILPGVGHFSYGMDKLRATGLIDILEELVVVKKIPILGICLGAQLMCKFSEEGNVSGLGWFDVVVNKFKIESSHQKKYKIPHMGWNNVHLLKESKLFAGLVDNIRFYFVHSYHFVVNDPKIELARTNYCYDFVSALENENIFAVQFHPEKSHKFGMQLMNNFLEL